MIASLPHGWRITRFDPALRDEGGAYTEDTWTSVSDVGKSFGGAELTLAEYERVEALYIAAAPKGSPSRQAFGPVRFAGSLPFVNEGDLDVRGQGQ